MDERRIFRAGGTLPARIERDSSPLATPPSLEQVYHDYAPQVFRTARRMVASTVDAEDVTQDVLLQVLRKLPTFRGAAAFPSWLHRITVNTALSHRRKRAVREENRADDSLEVVLDQHPHDRPGPDAQLVQQETRRLIEAAIDRLPDAYRTVFLLSDVEGQPNAVAAELLGLSLPALKARLHRARQMLREELAAHFKGEE